MVSPRQRRSQSQQRAWHYIVFIQSYHNIKKILIYQQFNSCDSILMFRPDLFSMECCIGIEQDLSKRKLKVIASTFSLIELVEFVRLICVSHQTFKNNQTENDLE